MNTRNTKTLATLLLATALVGCSLRDKSGDYTKLGEIDGYEVVVKRDFERRIRICDKDLSKDSIYQSCLTAVDFGSADQPFDGRFDDIELWNIPKDNPIEKYVDLPLLEEIYSYISENGETWVPEYKR
ncbi:hypothetical protein CL619_01575 [archaeon]|nr:hypothetical protein [archaeon]|tara:strand:- start:1432 stop:1815 length:384 start_codon:yes stop_codon:yes gene_type:complete